MLPSVMPAATSAHRATRVGSQPGAMAFAVGYMAVWTATGLIAYTGVETMQPLVPSWDHGGRHVAAAVLFGTAAFDLAHLEANCLR